MITPKPDTTQKKSKLRKCIEFLMASWNSMLYWLMFKNYKSKNCCGVEGCDCNK
jgi:hypothetical protein|tara:strand:- start:1853 stop:2014 length:162 start_codon:yes stop_codon:yes gene_type:complete